MYEGNRGECGIWNKRAIKFDPRETCTVNSKSLVRITPRGYSPFVAHCTSVAECLCVCIPSTPATLRPARVVLDVSNGLTPRNDGSQCAFCAKCQLLLMTSLNPREARCECVLYYSVFHRRRTSSPLGFNFQNYLTTHLWTLNKAWHHQAAANQKYPSLHCSRFLSVRLF